MKPFFKEIEWDSCQELNRTLKKKSGLRMSHKLLKMKYIVSSTCGKLFDFFFGLVCYHLLHRLIVDLCLAFCLFLGHSYLFVCSFFFNFTSKTH